MNSSYIFSDESDFSPAESDISFDAQNSDSGSSSSSSDSDMLDESLDNIINESSFQNDTIHWKTADGSTLNTFMQPPNPIIQHVTNKTPYLYFRQFFTDNILDMIVIETNHYIQKRNHRDMLEKAITNNTEINHFLGILLYMGLVKLPKISTYWSNKKLYHNNFCRQLMPRDRFLFLLKSVHFSSNIENSANSSDISKVSDLKNMLVSNFKRVYTPGSDLVIDESIIPFRGRLKFRQYLPGKAHKYGIKIYKLTDPSGYTFDLEIYQGKDKQLDQNYDLPASTKVCNKLMVDYFGCGRTLTVDNFYTSIQLAKLCISNKTHLQGTLRRNRKGFPVLSSKGMKKGFITCREKNGIVCGLWKDKREIRFVSTKQNGDLIENPKKKT